MAGRTITVRVTGDSTQLVTALKRAQTSINALESTAAKSQGSLSRLEGGFNKVFQATALVAGGAAITQAFMSVVNSASRLEQAQGAVNVVFGKASGQMRTAMQSANDLGLAQSQYGELAAKFGAQLQNFGLSAKQAAEQTQGLIKLSSDLSATFGGTTEQAAEALSSVLRGEFERIEAYGISIKQAEVNTRAAAQGLTTSQAAISLVYERSRQAQGQWNREQETFAVAQQKAAAAFEDARAALGEGFLPIATKAADVVGGLADAFTQIPEGLRGFGTSLALGAGGIVAARTALGALSDKMNQTAERWRSLDIDAPFRSTIGADGLTKSSSALSKMANALPVVGALLIAGGEAFSFFSDKAKEGATSTQEFSEALVTTGRVSDAQLAALVSDAKASAAALGDYAKVQESFTRGAAFGGPGASSGGSFLGEWLRRTFTSDIARYQERVDNLNKSLDELFKVDPLAGASATRAIMQDLRDAGFTEEQINKDLAGSIAQMDTVMQSYSKSTQNAMIATDSLIATWQAGKDAADRFGEAMTAALAPLRRDAAFDEWVTSIRAAKEELSNNAGLKGFSDQAIQNRSTMRDLISQQLAFTQAQLEAGASGDEVYRTYKSQREALVELGRQTGLTRKQVERFLNSQGFSDKTIRLAIKATGIETTKRQVTNYLRELKKTPDRQRTIFEALTTPAEKRTAEQKRAYKSVPPRVRTILEAILKDGGLTKRQKAAIAAIPKEKRTELRALLKGGDIDGAIKAINAVKQKQPAKLDVDNNPANDKIADTSAKLSDLVNTAWNATVTITVTATGSAKGIELMGFSTDPGLGPSLPVPDAQSLGAALFGDVTAVEVPVDVAGQVQAMARAGGGSWLTNLLGGRVGSNDRKVKYKIEVDIRKTGEWTTAIDGLSKLERLIEKNRNDKGNLTATGQQYKTLLQNLKDEQGVVNKYLRRDANMPAYRRMLRDVEKLREQYRALKQEIRDAVFGVDAGGAFSGATSAAQTAADEVKRLTEELDNLDKAKEENAWNPVAVDYYNSKINETNTALNTAKNTLARIGSIDAFGNVTPNATAVREQLQAQILQTVSFMTNVRRLAGQGFSQAAIQNLVAMGPAEGSKMAQLLVDDKALREQFASAFANGNDSILSQAAQLGKDIATQFYDPQIQAQTKAIAEWEKRIAEWLDKRRKLKLDMVVDLGDLEGQVPNWLKKYLKDLYDPRGNKRDSPLIGKSASVPVYLGGSSGTTRQVVNNIYIEGQLIDREGAARAIEEVLVEHSARMGGWA